MDELSPAYRTEMHKLLVRAALRYSSPPEENLISPWPICWVPPREQEVPEGLSGGSGERHFLICRQN